MCRNCQYVIDTIQRAIHDMTTLPLLGAIDGPSLVSQQGRLEGLRWMLSIVRPISGELDGQPGGDVSAPIDAHQIGQLLSERAHTIEVLTRFYRSEISLSSLQPVLDLARDLNPALDERPVR